MKRKAPKRLRTFRHNNSPSGNMCWRLKQKYDRYIRTNAAIGVCQEEGKPDKYCRQFGDPAYRYGKLGRNRACTACGRYWIS